MNLYTEYVIPAIIILIANVFSHEHGSKRYEIITAIFGWIGFITFISFLILYPISMFYHNLTMDKAIRLISQICALSLTTAIARDYEKYLKRHANYFEDKLKALYNFLRRMLNRF